MTELERRILGPLARRLRVANPGVWSTLKHQSQFGPEDWEFPYYPAALDFQDPAHQMISGLDLREKSLLLESWRSRPRLLRLEKDEEILRQYGLVLLDLLLKRAKQAAARTGDW